MRSAIKEFILILMMGCLPAWFVLYFDGLHGLMDFVSSSLVANYIFYYFLCAFSLHVILAFFFKNYGGRLEKENRLKVRENLNLIGDISSGLLGIYRATSGLLLFVPIAWLYTEPQTLSLYQMLGMFAYSLLFFVGVTVISNIDGWARNQL